MIDPMELFNLASRIFKVIFSFIKVVFKICKISGGWIIIPVGLLSLQGSFSSQILYHFNILTVLFWANIPFVLFTIIQNSVRYVSKDPAFSLWGVILQKSNAAPIGSVKELQVDKDKVSGIYFGKRNKKYVTKKEHEDGQCIVFGGSGSGKSSCIAIPTLMTWTGRVFAIDIKGELSKKSKRQGIVFNPLDPNCKFGYDPYFILNKGTNYVQDAREIAISLIPLPENTKDPFWIQSAQNLFTACILYFWGLGRDFIQTIELIQSTPIQEILECILDSDDLDAKMYVNQFAGIDPRTLSSIYSEMSNKIIIFATDPDLKRSLSSPNPVSPDDLEHGNDIFFQLPEYKLEQWKDLVSLIVQQFLKHFERRSESENLPILFMLDEFARIGKIDSILNGLATLRSKKVTILILTQSLAQLELIYGKEGSRAIVGNCTYQAILNATDADTQEYFSRLVGTFDSFDRGKSVSNGKFGHSNVTINFNVREKKIIKPEEFSHLKDIVLLTPFGFMRVDKSPYYSDSMQMFLKNTAAGVLN